MAGNKKKNPDKDLIHSEVEDLSSGDPTHLFIDMDSQSSNDDSGFSKPEELSKPEGLGSSVFETKLSINHGEKTSLVPTVPTLEYSGLDEPEHSASSTSEKTIVVSANKGRKNNSSVQEKTSFGVARPSNRASSAIQGSVTEAQLQQAENLRVAQERITELEKELEKLRAENETLFSTSATAKAKADELALQLSNLEKERVYQIEQYQSEQEILKDSIQNKDRDLHVLKSKNEELESRLKLDLRKIRVRERELENRLEIIKMEKEALLKAKDDSILELKRKLDQQNHELESYKDRVTDLNQKIENNYEQLSRTVRALRLALANLEVNDVAGSMTISPLKKAE